MSRLAVTIGALFGIGVAIGVAIHRGFGLDVAVVLALLCVAYVVGDALYDE